MKRHKLIASVKVRKPAVYVGEPLAIKVITWDSKYDESIEVAVNGVPGKSQYLQFPSPGREKITIVAASSSLLQEQRSLEVQVMPRPNKSGQECLFPIIGISQNFLLRNGVTFSLDNPDDFSDQDVYYVWEFPKNIRFPSTTPILDYSFDNQLDPDALYTNFDIKLHVKTRDHMRVYTGRRTMTVWNSYALNKRRGFIQLKVKSEIYAYRDSENYIGCFSISNLESNPINFDSAQIEYLYDDPEKICTPGQPFDYKWKIGPNETLNQEFNLKIKEFPKDAFGFGVHFSGQTKGKLPAFAHVYFEVRTNPYNVRPLRDPEVLSILKTIRNKRVLRNPNVISLPQFRRLLDSDPSFSEILLHSQLQPYPPANDLISRVLRSAEDIPPMTKLMSDEEDVIEGEECSPVDEANPREGFTCQLTDDWSDEIVIPARIINARKGDVIVSPGDDSPVARMLRRLEPPQFYDHVGIMIENFYKIKHSTPSVDWLTETGLARRQIAHFWDAEGREGFNAFELTYIWPGTIVQTIDQAFEGSMETDPSGKEREIKAFKNRSTSAGAYKLIEPCVVKPHPKDEVDIPELRQLLHKVADKAKEIEAHYRFYCFTNANAFFEEESLAPDVEWLAKENKRRPTVCSSFVWAAAKSVEDPTIILERREEGSYDSGEEVDENTRDGLYRYEEAERIAAGQALYDYIYDEVYEKAKEDFGSFKGAFLAWEGDAAPDAANQVCNTFASDSAIRDNEGNLSKDSEAWRKPGIGHAVSPDNILLYWDRPVPGSSGIRGLYGYSEPLIYRLARFEERRRISRWTRTTGEAILEGTVLYQQEPVAGAYVLAAGRDCVTNNAGEFWMIIPDGSYRVEAGKYNWNSRRFISTRQDVMNVQVNERRNITLILADPDGQYREIKVLGSMWITDDEWLVPNEHAVRDIVMDNILVGPSTNVPNDDNEHAEVKQTEKMGGEIRVRLQFEFDWQDDASVDAWYRAELFEGDTEDTDTLRDSEEGNINIPRSEDIQFPPYLGVHLVNPEGDDTVDISLIIINNPES